MESKEALISECVKVYAPKLIAYARSVCGNGELAKDAVQNVFIKLCSLEKIETATLGAWLYKTCRNNVYDVLRKDSKLVGSDYIHSLCDASPLPDESASDADHKRLVRKEIAQLPPKQRELIMLRFYSEMSYEEIAEIADIPVGSVGVMIARGVEVLKNNVMRKDLSKYGS